MSRKTYKYVAPILVNFAEGIIVFSDNASGKRVLRKIAEYGSVTAEFKNLSIYITDTPHVRYRLNKMISRGTRFANGSNLSDVLWFCEKEKIAA